MPTLSVVVPTRDTCALTLRCLAAVYAAPRPPDQVIVVDDGSLDGTAAAIGARFPAVRVLRLAEPAGFTRAVNHGWAAADGDLTLLLNSDTELDPGAIEAFLRAFADDPRLGIAGGMLRFPDGRPQWSAGPTPSPTWLFGVASGLPALLGRIGWLRRWRPERQGGGAVAWVPATAMVVRREVAVSIGRFDEAYRLYAQDLVYGLRAGAEGWRVAVIGDAGVLHHRGATVSGAIGAPGRKDADVAALLRDLGQWLRADPTPEGPARRRAWRAGLRVRIAGRRAGDLIGREDAGVRAATEAYRDLLRRMTSS